MGRVSDVEIPEGGIVNEQPVPEVNTVDPQQAYNLTAGPLRRGLRSGFNQLGAMTNAFASSVASSMGEEEFAADRMRRAEDQARFANEIAPDVRSHSEVKDFESLAQYVQGIIGQSLATTTPAIAGGVLGRGAFGLRGAYGGAFAGGFVPLAGEQAQRLAGGPGTPGEKLKNIVTTGATNAAMESLLPGRVAGKAATAAKAGKSAVGSITKETAKGIGIEGLTEGAQEATGQAMQKALDPNAEFDPEAIIEGSIQGAIGGGAISAGGAATAKGIGAVHDLLGKEQTMKDVNKGLNYDTPVPNEFDDSDILNDNSAVTEQDILDRIEAKGEKSVQVLGEYWDKLKEDPKFAKFKDFAEDPTVRSEFIDALKERANELDVKPRIERAIKSVAAFGKGVDKALRARGEKLSRQRTTIDVSIYDNMIKNFLPEEAAKNMTPEQKLELASNIKHAAMYDFGRRDESGQLAQLPQGLMDIFGDKTTELLNSTNDLLTKAEVTTKRDFKPHVEAVQRTQRRRLTQMEEIVRNRLRPEIAANPEARDHAAKVLAPRLIEAVQSGNLNQSDLDYAFGKSADDVVESLDKLRDTWSTQSVYEDIENIGQDPMKDPRVKSYASIEEARTAVEDLRSDYSSKDVSFTAKQNQETQSYEVVAEPRASDSAFTEDEWKAVRESEAYGRSTVGEGVITVRMKDKAGGDTGNLSNKVNLVRLTSAMIRSTPNADATSKNYIADMVHRGLTKLLSDPRVRTTGAGGPEGSPFTEGTAKQIKAKPDGGFDLPDNTPVAYYRGQLWRWGDIKDLESPQTKVAQRLRDQIKALPGKAEFTDVNGVRVPVNKKAKAIRELSQYYDTQREDYAYANTKEQEITDNADGNPDVLESGADELRQEAESIKEGRTGDALKALWKGKEGASRRRRYGYLQAAANRLDSEAERIRSGQGEYGEGAVVTDIVKDIVERQPERARVVEPDTGTPLTDLRKTPQSGGTKLTPSMGVESATPKKTQKAKKAAKKASKKSEMNIGPERELTDDEKIQIKEFVARTLGPKAKVFLKKMKEAGSFHADEDGTETIRISTMALDPFGAARHEAAHALIRRLVRADKEISRVLLAAAGSPTVISRLRTLLKDHPDALKQLSDPEERLAYMYQFWASKQLVVGPNTKTVFGKVKSFLRKVAGLWSELGVDIHNQETTERVFELFDNGVLANPAPDAVRRVLLEKVPGLAWDRASSLMPAVGRFVSKAFFTADGIVRRMNVPAFSAISNKFYASSESTDADSGYLQTRYVEFNKRLNKLDEVLRKHPDKQIQDLALEALHSGTTASNPAAQEIVDNIRTILRETFAYMKDKGVKVVEWNEDEKNYQEHELKFVKNYFPRFYDRQKISENIEEFKKDLADSGIAEGHVNTIVGNLLHGTRVAPEESDYLAGLTYYAPNTQARKVDVPDAVLAKWLIKDLSGTMYSYLNYATRRAEYASRFGNQGQEIEAAIDEGLKQGATQEQVRTFNQAVKAMEGSLGHDINPQLKRVLGGVVTYQNFRLLPLALFTSLVDPIGIAVRGGGMSGAFQAFVRGIRGIVNEQKDVSFDLASSIGTISTSTDAHMLAESYGTQYLSETWRKANDFFFRFNGMESWNRQMRIAATGIAAKFIMRHAQGVNEHSERYLRELGITKDDVKVEDGNLVLNDKIEKAVARWVDGAVLRPNAAIRPIWMSDPHYMLIAHLKQFTYSFQKTIIARVVHEVEQGNYTPALALVSYVPLIIASDIIRYMATPGGGDDDALKRLGLDGIIWRGAQRAGIFGPGQYALDSFGDLGHAKLPVSSLLGPSIQQLLDFGWALAGQGNVGTELKKAVPGYVLVR